MKKIRHVCGAVIFDNVKICPECGKETANYSEVIDEYEDEENKKELFKYLSPIIFSIIWIIFFGGVCYGIYSFAFKLTPEEASRRSEIKLEQSKQRASNELNKSTGGWIQESEYDKFSGISKKIASSFFRSGQIGITAKAICDSNKNGYLELTTNTILSITKFGDGVPLRKEYWQGLSFPATFEQKRFNLIGYTEDYKNVGIFPFKSLPPNFFSNRNGILYVKILTSEGDHEVQFNLKNSALYNVINDECQIIENSEKISASINSNLEASFDTKEEFKEYTNKDKKINLALNQIKQKFAGLTGRYCMVNGFNAYYSNDNDSLLIRLSTTGCGAENSYFDISSLYSKFKDGKWTQVDSLEYFRIKKVNKYGEDGFHITSIEYGPDDAHCCPSVVKDNYVKAK